MKNFPVKESKYQLVVAPVLSTEKVVIPDECGDSMWEAVLAQNNTR